MRRFFCILISALLALSLAGCAFLPIDFPDTPSDSSEHRVSSSTQTTDKSSATTSDTDTIIPDKRPHDIRQTPISQLTADEQKQLADYLFESYIPCSFGIFSDPSKLSSASVWSSVEALNRKVDGDESEESRTLEKVLEKVKIYYPDTPFNPEQVRVYDPATKTFAPSPADTQSYEMLSYEVKGDTITVHYQDKSDADDPDFEVRQYATTLKNSKTKGYFTFVSSETSGAVG